MYEDFDVMSQEKSGNQTQDSALLVTFKERSKKVLFQLVVGDQKMVLAAYFGLKLDP